MPCAPKPGILPGTWTALGSLLRELCHTCAFSLSEIFGQRGRLCGAETVIDSAWVTGAFRLEAVRDKDAVCPRGATSFLLLGTFIFLPNCRSADSLGSTAFRKAVVYTDGSPSSTDVLVISHYPDTIPDTHKLKGEFIWAHSF